MGMGKTIQTISLIVASKKKYGKQGPTLVVSPSSSMLQWMDETKSTTLGGTLSVLVYHGNKRGQLTPGELCEHDMILTSYPILEYEYRQCLARAKIPCQYCKKLFLPRKLGPHNKFFCGPNSKRSAKLALTDKKAETEKSKKTMGKAMKTLSIGSSKRHSLPTPSNIYREYMQKANKKPMGRFTSRSKAQELQQASTCSSSSSLSSETTLALSTIVENEETETATPSSEAQTDTSRRGSSSLKRVDSDDFVVPTAVQYGTKRHVWSTPTHDAFIFRMNNGKKWISNFVYRSDSASSNETMVFTVDRKIKSYPGSSSTLTVVLSLVVNPQVKVSIHPSGAAELSVDGGEEWRFFSDGTWISNAKSNLDKNMLKEGWSATGDNVGTVIARKFDSQNVFFGMVIAYAPEDEENDSPLWRVQHMDGDVEDLEKVELEDAINLAEKTAAKLLSKPAPESNDELFNLIVSLGGSVVKMAPKKEKKPRKKAAGAKKTKSTKKAKKRRKTDDSDSDFVMGSEDDIASDTDDNNYVSDTDDEIEDVAPAKSKTKAKSNSSAVIQYPETLKPRFRPVKWGARSKDGLLFSKLKALHSKAKRGKKRKKRTKAKKKKKKQEDSDGEDVVDVVKATTKEPNGKGKKAKKVSVDSSSSESEDDGEDEETVESVLASEQGGRWSDGSFWFAPKGEVVDDDGVDMGTSLLHCIGWHRIVLDEAHKIKDRVNSTAKAALALRGDPSAQPPSCSGSSSSSQEPDKDDDCPDGGFCHRWCLTGTPLQNRIGDLYSLVRFLRIDPYAYYFCKRSDCDCRMLHWSFGTANRGCENCGHPPMSHYSFFNQSIINPIKRNGHVGAGQRAMKILRDELLAELMLRRTKQERQKDIELPPMTVTVQMLEFTPEEEDFYQSIYMNTRAKFDTYVEKGTLLHNYAHIFELLSRLRRAADHPYLVCHGASDDVLDNADGSRAVVAQRKKHRADVCGICHFDIPSLDDCAMASCRHTFHKSCLQELYDDENNDSDVEEDELEGGPKKKKAKKPKKKKKKTKKGEITAPDCPVCYVPLSVTLNLKGGTEQNQSKQNQQKEKEKKSVDDDVCVVCMENPRNALLMPCAHIYLCMGCAKKLETKSCPMCRSDITKISKVDPNVSSKAGSVAAGSDVVSAALVGRKSILQRINLRNFSTSTKVKAVCDAVKEMMGEDQNSDNEIPNKAIVFSQYTDMLDLVEWSLKNSGVKTVKLVGSLSMNERRAVLAAFKTDPTVSVLLMSLKAGGEGLNLQEASHVFITDVWWNFAIESQAIQRAHRIGQKRAVKAVRFVTKGSIEEKMLELQQKKMLVFEGTVDGSQTALAKLSQEDLCFLFSKG